MIDIRQLQYFVAVSEELHFSKAADRLGVAQSWLSTQVQRLERDLGVALFSRNKRQPVALTDAGRLFLAEAVAALRHIDRADQVGRLAARGFAGVIRIAFVASGASSGILSKVLSEFRHSHENVRIEILPMETPRQLQALNDGEIDIGILRPRAMYPPGIEARVIHAEGMLLAMPEGHGLANAEPIPARALADESFIVPEFDDEEGFGCVLLALGKAGDFTPRFEHRVQDFISAVSLASAGYGVGIVPASMRNFAQPGICYRRIADISFFVHLAMAHREREPSPAVRAFVTIALSVFRGANA